MAGKTAKKLSLLGYLCLLSISQRDVFVVKRLLRIEAQEDKTVKEWDSIFKAKCKDINYKKVKAKK